MAELAKAKKKNSLLSTGKMYELTKTPTQNPVHKLHLSNFSKKVSLTTHVRIISSILPYINVAVIPQQAIKPNTIVIYSGV